MVTICYHIHRKVLTSIPRSAYGTRWTEKINNYENYVERQTEAKNSQSMAIHWRKCDFKVNIFHGSIKNSENIY